MTPKDKSILRDLAKKQMECASSPENKKREDEWYKHNDLKGSRPLVTVDEWTFGHELARPLSCETEMGRDFESRLMDEIIAREDIDDDRSTPDFFPVKEKSWFTPFGMESKRIKVDDGIAYEYEHKVLDLETDRFKLKGSKWGMRFSDKDPNDKSPNGKSPNDRGPNDIDSDEEFQIACDVFGDIMPVKLVSAYPEYSMSQILIRYMSMENMLFALMDYPEWIHETFDRLTCDLFSYYKEKEQAGVLITNCLNQKLAQGTYSHTNDLNYKKGAAMSDMWGYFDSQETVGISPKMFEEFFFPYYKRIMDMCGLVNYGCCEPVDKIWDNCLSKCKNIRKLSISPWCDEEFIADKLRGSSTIYHRKPSPNLVGAVGDFDEGQYREHILATLKAAKGCKLEFSLRDIYSLNGDKTRARRAVQIIRDLIDQNW